MSKKILGYKRMEWICPNCGARNPGPENTCSNCGAPQPEDVAFVLPETADYIKSEEEIKHAQSGPDIYCPYCHARNPAGSQECLQCGAPLDEGKQRQAGEPVQVTHEGNALICPACKAENPPGSTTCQQCGAPLQAPAAQKPQSQPSSPATKKPKTGLLITLALFFLLCCGGIYLLFMRPAKTLSGQVSDVYWQTSVSVQQVQAVQYRHQEGNPPSEAYNVHCETESRQICATKTVDKGNGYAEVVEECHDENTRYCDYTLDEWHTIQSYPAEGHTLTPQYVQPPLGNGQRLGEKTIFLEVTFTTEEGKLTYQPDSISEFQQYVPGSNWQLTLNAVGQVLSVSPP